MKTAGVVVTVLASMLGAGVGVVHAGPASQATDDDDPLGKPAPKRPPAPASKPDTAKKPAPAPTPAPVDTPPAKPATTAKTKVKPTKKPSKTASKAPAKKPADIDIEVDAAPPPPPPVAPVAPAAPRTLPPATSVSLSASASVSASAAAPLDEPVQPRADADGDGSTAVVAVASRPSYGGDRWHLSAGVLFLDPLSTSKALALSNVSGPASLAVQNGPIAGSGASVDGATLPALILGYDLPYHHHQFALETVLATPITVKFEATGTLANMSLAPTVLGIPTGVPPLGSQLGEAKAIPPLVTLVYSPLRGERLQPYVGVGATVMFTYDAKVTNPILTQVAQPQLNVSPAPGLVLQTGLTAPITHGFFARVDVKFVAFLTANAEVEDIQVKTPDLPLFSSVEVGTAKMSVTVNPLIVQAGIGKDF
jgi:outer membrane protein W